ncbi:hypothetical protein FRC06_011278, partial [Ceratobasidium sp. 370]
QVNDVVGHQKTTLGNWLEPGMNDEEEDHHEQDTDAEINQLADDTSILGLRQDEHERIHIEQENRYLDRLQKETLEYLDEDDESIDEYEEDEAGTTYDNIIDIETSESSFCAVLEESDNDLTAILH